MDKEDAIDFIKTHFDVLDLYQTLHSDSEWVDCIVLDDNHSMVCSFFWNIAEPEKFVVNFDPTWWHESFEFTLTFAEIGL